MPPGGGFRSAAEYAVGHAVGRQYRLPSGSTLVQLYPGDEAGAMQFMLGRLCDSGHVRTAELKAELEAPAGRTSSNRQPWTKVQPILEN